MLMLHPMTIIAEALASAGKDLIISKTGQNYVHKLRNPIFRRAFWELTHLAVSRPDANVK